MINLKSFNRSIAESLFNLANNNIAQLTDAEGETSQRESNIFAESFDAADINTPLPQHFIGDGVTKEYVLNGEPARSDLIDVYCSDVLQRAGEIYDVQEGTLIFTETPYVDMDIYIKFR